MSLPRVDILLNDSRILSLQQDYGEEYGIQQSFFLKALNQANLKIQRYMVNAQAEPFADYDDIPVVAGQNYVQAPSNMFSHKHIYDCWYSPTGEEERFGEPLDLAYKREFGRQGYPTSFYPDNGLIYLDYAPQDSSGILRVRFESRLNRWELRRAIVNDITIADGALTIIGCNITDSTPEDLDALSRCEYICLVDDYGTVKARNIPVLGFDTTTGFFQLQDSGWPIPDGQEVNTNYWVMGVQDSSTHSTLPDMMEDYFIEFCKQAVFEAISDEEEQGSEDKMKEMLAECAEIYAQKPNSRLARIPQNKRYC